VATTRHSFWSEMAEVARKHGSGNSASSSSGMCVYNASPFDVCAKRSTHIAQTWIPAISSFKVDPRRLSASWAKTLDMCMPKMLESTPTPVRAGSLDLQPGRPVRELVWLIGLWVMVTGRTSGLIRFGATFGWVLRRFVLEHETPLWMLKRPCRAVNCDPTFFSSHLDNSGARRRFEGKSEAKR